MDAQTVAAAALAVVVDDSREAAVRELLLERDRLANDLELAHADLELARDAMRGVLRHVEAGRVLWAMAMLSEHLDSYIYTWLRRRTSRLAMATLLLPWTACPVRSAPRTRGVGGR